MTFAPAPEYTPFPTGERPLQPYVAAERAAREMDALLAEFEPDALVHDVLTIAPALAAERRGIRVATLIPHLYPGPARGLPPFSIGARIPRTPVGRAFWRALGAADRPRLGAGARAAQRDAAAAGPRAGRRGRSGRCRPS